MIDAIGELTTAVHAAAFALAIVGISIGVVLAQIRDELKRRGR
jgi:hypothetical protein